MRIRQICLDSISEVAAIEQTAQSPWSAEQIASELKNSISRQIVIVDNTTESVRGWSCYHLIPPEAELLKITVHPDFKRKKVGTLLLQYVINDCMQQGCSDLFLEVREKNDNAHYFYKSHGFLKISVRNNYYSDPLDNGIIYQKPL